MECIVLAGGLGTRLKSEVPDLPKCMALINGYPFLEYLFNYLESQFMDHVILALGHQHQVVSDWLNGKGFTFKIQRVIEQEPLGTGGAIKLALRKAKEPNVFVLNGDTLYNADLRAMRACLQPQDKAVVALKPMKDFYRYGAVKLNEQQLITGFEEKKPQKEGLINGGIYLLNTALENYYNYPDVFSFEREFLEKEASKGLLRAYQDDHYFIDIGVPEDYQRAQEELRDWFE